MENLEVKLSGMQTELAAYFAKAADEQKATGLVATETKEALTKLQKQVDTLDASLAAKHAGASEPKTLEQELKENESVAKLVKDRRGRAVFTLKTTVTSAAVGAATTGVLQIDRTAGIVSEARQALTIRNLLASRPTAMQVLDFVKVNATMHIASPAAEASTKAENALTFTSTSEKVRTLAHWIPATRQILDDFSELAGFINSSLTFYLNKAEELQLLTGDGTGENLNGLLLQAADFTPSLLSASAGWTKADIVLAALQQIAESNELDATFVVLHNRDWFEMLRAKDGFGRPLFGTSQNAFVNPTLHGLQVVATNNIAQGTFLIGSGSNAAAEIRDRMGVEVEVSTEDSDNFRKNLVTVRAEKRLALVTYRPASFVNGSFTSSPA